MGEIIYNKLVRDKIPEIIKADNEIPIIRILDTREYKMELEKKFLEEYQEYLTSKNKKERLEELADILEIIAALGQLENTSLEEVMKEMAKKAKKRGSFSKRIFLEKTITK